MAMATESLDSVLDRLLGPDERDAPLAERRALALEVYGVPDEVMTRPDEAGLAIIDKGPKTVKRWEEQAGKDGRDLFPGAIELPGGSRRYPPDAVLRFLARSRAGAEQEDEPTAGSPGGGNQITEPGTDDDNDGPDDWRDQLDAA